MDPVNLPHPLTTTLSKEQLERDYLNVTIDRCADPAWRFRLNLQRSTRIAPGGEVGPTVAEPFQTLALFQRPEPLADLEIFGLHLPAEVNTSDWLDLWLERHKMSVASRYAFATPRGTAGDCVCTWATHEGSFAGRFVALRWGPRVFLVTLRTPQANYGAIADDFFLAASSLTPLAINESTLNGEPHHEIAIAAPAKATIRLPASYALDTDFSDPRVAALSAEQQPITDLPDDPSFGKINVLLAAASLADHPAKAAAMYLDPLLRNPVKLGGDEFVEETDVAAPFEQAWSIVTPATFTARDGEAIPCEMRCRVMARADLWLVAGVLGPARHAAPIAWMRNKRALELVTTSVTLA